MKAFWHGVLGAVGFVACLILAAIVVWMLQAWGVLL